MPHLMQQMNINLGDSGVVHGFLILGTYIGEQI
ncbi:hypothetical protein VCRA2113O324_80033 [Vibrio crassostreae]|nr:hypothetical protein VCRA2111O320_100034 [Vibrio crassostreae]CAK2236577.1 hypothetical protein VCRA2113O324_80033 [Vibrio crassostreae]CAK3142634.1 hypothetical protein VCRA2121O336_80222 [Vibrio crassostreae]CAK3482871.1 hypothetical protein VCRA217O316_30252 [Vibrio crassostreae]CAK3606275.1 hypothetical protein VCRA2120O329_70034 [Vibrio crassostreae]